jgi:hypothetical protein
MGLPVLHVSGLVGVDGSGISDITDMQGRLRALGGAASEAAPMPMGRTARHLQAIFWRRTWGGSQTMPSRLLADSGPFAGFRWSGSQDRRQPRWAALRGTERTRVSC